MAVTEQDLELLDSYLDDALEIGEVDALRARLSGDGELVAALDQIRRERAARRSFYSGLEPDDAAVGAVVSKIQCAAARQKRITARARAVRSGILAAACLLLGFYARGIIDRAPSPTHDPGTSLVENKTGVNVQKVSSYQVTLRDETGKVVAVQRFDSMEKAQEFAADLARWQSHSERLASGRFVLSADRF
jgi:anti-sigma factor RsiW